jgi:TIR domain
MSPGILSEAVTARDVPARFAVAFSLAGEQRQLVLAVAQEVEAVLGRSTVFYDAWYEHWIAGNDADLLLQHVYSDMSELVVFCVSGHYGGKPWTQTEHRAIRARMMQSDSVAERRILPVRVGDGEVDGVLFTDIVPDLRTKTPTEAAELIIARLNLVRGPADGIDHANVQWPTDPPVLQWPIADHSEARRAFAMLLTALSPSRLLLVQGPSETGKTHMSKQMMRNVMGLGGVACGRFEFKGTTNMGVEVEAFSQALGIEPPEGQTLNQRLGKIFGDMRRRAGPLFLFLTPTKLLETPRTG